MTNVLRKIEKILIILVIINIIFAIVNVSQALSLSNIIESGDEFLSTGKGEADYKFFNSQKAKGIISNIYSIIFPLGVAITVIVGGVLGTKFMLASAEDKAKIKESLVPYVIGCIVIYGAIGIWTLTINIMTTTQIEAENVDEKLYTKKGDKYYCNSCKKQLGVREVRNSHCDTCNIYLRFLNISI